MGWINVNKNIQCDFTKTCHCCGSRTSKPRVQKYSFVYTDHTRKVIYHSIPKCGSTSLRSMLFPNKGRKADYASLIPYPVYVNEYFKFTVCRNPYSRAVSNYVSFTTQPGRVKQMKQFVREPGKLTFEEFLIFASQVKNHHWLPQVNYIKGYQLDYIGKLENIQKDYRVIMRQIRKNSLEQLCLSSELSHEQLVNFKKDNWYAAKKQIAHANSSTQEHYTSYYNDTTFKMVSDLYREDLSFFKYSFGD